MSSPTPHSALLGELSLNPARPLLTYVGPEGRTELSVRSFQNGVAKAAGLLRDGLDVQPGDAVALLLPAHWQTAIWLGACWSAGAVAHVLPSSYADAVVVLATAQLLPQGPTQGEVLRVSRHPFGLTEPEPLPAGVLDAALEVRAHGDVFTPYSEPSGHDMALNVGGAELTAGEVMAAAAELAATLSLAAGGRLLTTRRLSSTDLSATLALLAVPLAVSGRVVISPAPVADEPVDAELR